MLIINHQAQLSPLKQNKTIHINSDFLPSDPDYKGQLGLCGEHRSFPALRQSATLPVDSLGLFSPGHLESKNQTRHLDESMNIRMAALTVK